MRGRVVTGTAALLGLLGLAVLVAGCGGSHPAAAATVDGTAVPRATLVGELDAIHGNAAGLAELERQGPVSGTATDGFSPAFVAQVLNAEVEAVVVAREVASRHLAVPAGLGAAVSAEDSAYAAYPADYKEAVATRTANRLVLAAALAGTPLTDASIASYYAAHRSDFTQYCVSGLALGSQADAAAVRAQLAGGSALAPIATARSIDPNTRDDGGVLGCGDLGVFPTLGTTIAALAPKTYSAPVQVGQSWYVIAVTSTTVTALTQAEPTLVQDLITQYGPFNTFLQQALAAATVTVDPAYGRFDRTSQPPSVVAP